MSYQFPDSVLLIFCKAPIVGQVKTRLQPELTAEQAASAHIKLTRMTLERAVQQSLCPIILCCAPDTEQPFFRQCTTDYPLTLIRQRGSDLGERMHNAFTDALTQYGHALLIGCDCPSLTVTDLRQALAALQNGVDVVTGPAEDGGYVLIGLSNPQPILFRNMPWGTGQVIAKTRRLASEAGLNLYELSKQWDVDTIEDWRRYLRSDYG